MSERRWFDDQYPLNAPLVILHPNFANQHRLLPLFLERTTHLALFVTVQTPNADLSSFWGLLSLALAEQANAELPPTPATPQKAGKILGDVLLSLGYFVLIIDGFDLLEQKMACDLIAHIRVNAPSQIILSGRRLPLDLFENTALHGKMALFPVTPERMLLDYATAFNGNKQPGDKLLEVYACGPGRVLVNGRLIENWDGVLPRALFFYFIDRGMTTRDEIFSTFWPNLPVREATNVFHVTKRKISEILGFDLTVYWSGFYRITPDINLNYDVVQFAEHVQNGEVADDKTGIELLEHALYLYHGTFLSTLDYPWVQARREDLQMTYVDAIGTLARLRERSGQDTEALGLYVRAGAMQPYREDFARSAMMLYDRLGQPARALSIYDRLASELSVRLDVSPDRRTMELADVIRSRAMAAMV